MKGYQEQWARMLRALRRASEPGDDRVEKDDDFIVFFMHCWHLKDHIKHDRALSKEVRARIVSAAHKNEYLMIAQQIANGMKHFVPKEVQMLGHNDMTVYVDNPPRARTDPLVAFKNGASKRAYEIAEKCRGAWDEILAAENLLP